eukprot:CAMPEP_0197435604 /NCGR_PEP_ID=MMETSP1175-20131217/3172_1 /TAXON_ID=1003142 /ORGANISM="Triceratium dubium, Strain CCMP147" /LENGTH=196 /DNA_ID=CAMNT_0042964683 /DNA_START=104 /DNA_END=694 /DNA_ORIENTATION=+
MRFSVKAFAVVLGATLLLSSNVPVAFAEVETAEAIVSETGEAEVVAPECPNPNADGSCPNPDAEVSEESVSEESVSEGDSPKKETATEELTEKEPEDPSCPSRPHIIRCAAAYLDKNKNDKLEREELQTAIDALPWLSRGVLKILGSVDKIMQKCDADGDDAIGMHDDMEKTKEQCLASCFKRKAFKSAFFSDCDL